MTIYNGVEETTAEEIFKEYEIPEQFHKIAFSLPTLPFQRYAIEVLTDRYFVINRSLTDISGKEHARFSCLGHAIPGSIDFTTPRKKTNYNTIFNFYEQLATEGYLETYIQAIKNIFYQEDELLFSNKKDMPENKAAALLKTRQNKKAS